MTATVAQLGDDQVRRLRLRSLLLDGTGAGGIGESVDQVVTWMGAMQAQDHASGLWSLGIRLPGSTEASVTAALESREALRTWPMRGTVHLVPSRDARWMLELMSAKPLAGAAARREYLGLTDDVVERSNAALEAALRGGGRLNRAECVEVIADAGIQTPGQVGYHLLWYASQVGLTCIAPGRDAADKGQTFVLLDEWVPNPARMSREEALAEIALRYFRGHGPATVKDLARWTGLGVRDCRAGVAGAGEALVSVETSRGPMLATAEALDAVEGLPSSASSFLVTPGFDEFMLGYGDRDLLLDPADMAAVVPGGNGVFRATLVRYGQVVGTWKRTLRAASVVIEVVPLARIGARERRAFAAAFARYGKFLERGEAQVIWS